jgi:hypothetical protein
MSILPRFYVYVLCRPNGKPFYVGKGSKMRVFGHEREARRGCKCHKCNVIRKIWRQGGEVQRYTILTTDDEQEALDYECSLIALHGRENLTNHTDGGEGVTGYSVPLEVRTRQSISHKALWRNPNHRARMMSPDRSAKMSAMCRDRYLNPEFRAKITAAREKRWADPEQHQRLADRNRMPEMRAALSATKKAQWADPEFRAKMVEARRRRIK